MRVVSAVDNFRCEKKKNNNEKEKCRFEAKIHHRDERNERTEEVSLMSVTYVHMLLDDLPETGNNENVEYRMKTMLSRGDNYYLYHHRII